MYANIVSLLVVASLLLSPLAGFVKAVMPKAGSSTASTTIAATPMPEDTVTPEPISIPGPPIRHRTARRWGWGPAERRAGLPYDADDAVASLSSVFEYVDLYSGQDIEKAKGILSILKNQKAGYLTWERPSVFSICWYFLHFRSSRCMMPRYSCSMYWNGNLSFSG